MLVVLRQMLIKETQTWWLPLLENCRNQTQASKKVQKFWKEDEIDDMWHDRIFSKSKTWKSSSPYQAVFSFLSVYTISSFVWQELDAFLKLKEAKGRTFYGIGSCHASKSGWWPNTWQLDNATVTGHKDFLGYVFYLVRTGLEEICVLENEACAT